jgi:hypothetical protein
VLPIRISGYATVPRGPDRLVVTVRWLAEKIPGKTHGRREVRSTIHPIVIGKGRVSTLEIFSAMLAFNEQGNSHTNANARPDST